MMNPQRQEQILSLLQDEKLRTVIESFEKDHAITILLLLYAGLGRWGRAKETMRGLGITINDGTFRARLLELEHRTGLAHSKRLDPKKKEYFITTQGEAIASTLISFLENVQDGLKLRNPQTTANN